MEWYYASNGEQKGPVSQEELISLFERGEVKASDLVWNESMADWVAFGSVPELNAPSVSTDPGGAETPPPIQQEPAILTPAVATTATAAASTEKVPTYLWQSIVCLVLCCLPAAIPALIFATKVEPALKNGDVAAAKEASAKAKMWCWIAFGVGIVVNIIAFIVGIAGAMVEQT